MLFKNFPAQIGLGFLHLLFHLDTVFSDTVIRLLTLQLKASLVPQF